MTRLQRKCLVASVLAHAGLLGLLVLSAGFSSARPPQTEEVLLLTFVPDQLVDAPVIGGVTPAPPATPPPAASREPVVTPPPPPPQPPAPKPETRGEPPRKPEPRAAPQPPPEPVRTSPTGEKPEPPPRRKIEVNLNPVVRPSTAPSQERAREEAEARARAEAERLAQVRRSQLARVADTLSRKLSSSTTVTVPGTGGATYASYTSFVDLVYRQAWAPLKPREISERSLTVVARVVIARNGDVILSEIKRRSGNEAMDRSVRAALDRVRTIGRPFPEGARDEQREFEIEFHLEPTPGAG